MNIVDSLCKEAAYHAQQYNEKLAAANILNDYFHKTAADLGTYDFAGSNYRKWGAPGITDNDVRTMLTPAGATELGELMGSVREANPLELTTSTKFNPVTPYKDIVNERWAQNEVGETLNNAANARRAANAGYAGKILDKVNEGNTLAQLKTWISRNPWKAGLGAAAGLAGLGAAGYGLYNYMNPSNEEAEMAKAGSYNLTPQEKVAMYRQAFLNM